MCKMFGILFSPSSASWRRLPGCVHFGCGLVTSLQEGAHWFRRALQSATCQASLCVSQICFLGIKALWKFHCVWITWTDLRDLPQLIMVWSSLLMLTSRLCFCCACSPQTVCPALLHMFLQPVAQNLLDWQSVLNHSCCSQGRRLTFETAVTSRIQCPCCSREFPEYPAQFLSRPFLRKEYDLLTVTEEQRHWFQKETPLVQLLLLWAAQISQSFIICLPKWQ